MLATGQLVTISGATPIGFNGVYAITVTGATTFTYTLAADPGADGSGSMSALLDKGLIGQADSLGSSAGFEDLQDDGSQILNMTKLRDSLVIYRETSIFLCGTSGQNDIPFAFGLVYGGSLSGDKHAVLAFPNAVGTVNRSGSNTFGEVSDQFHVYPGKNDFYRFDLVTRTPHEFGPLHNVRNLFFNEVDESDADAVFVADNPVTKEIFFCYPSAFEGSGAINPNTGVPPPAPPVISIEPTAPPITPPPPPPPLFANTEQCATAHCPGGTTGPDQRVCVAAGTFTSNDPAVGQAGVDAQALAAATTQAEAQLVCDLACVDESCPFGWVWDGAEWICATGGVGNLGGVGMCRDVPANACIKDFTGISGLFETIKSYVPTPPVIPDPPAATCPLNPSNNDDGYGHDADTVHAEYQYGGGVDVNRVYTVTIRVRGVIEFKSYGNTAIAPYTGHQDPDQPFVFVFDPIDQETNTPGPLTSSTSVVCAGGENEYCLQIIEGYTNPPFSTEHRFQLNNAHVGMDLSSPIQAVDYTFKVQLKTGSRVTLGGTSVDQREFYNPPVFGGTPIIVGGAPTTIKRTEPYQGQFIQLDVISIDY